MTKHYNFYINGEWIGDSLEKLEVNNPATNEIIATVPYGGIDEAKQAVDGAVNAFKLWRKKTADERSQLLYRWYELIKENELEIATILTTEQGKPLQEALGEVRYANSYILWYAEEAKRVYGETIPASHEHKRILVQKQPVGVVACVTPWNFPAAMITRKVAPALAAGCTTVIKPASQTPLTAILLVKYAEEAGIPKGVVNVVTGSSNDIVQTWNDDKRVRKLTFTGSTEIGKKLMRDASHTMKKISLELGGHAPFIVMGDADIEAAAKGVVASKFRNAGQTCICTNRVYVQESVKDVFQNEVAKLVSTLKIGNGLDENVEVGPLIDNNAVNKVEDHIKDAIEKGATVVSGGEKIGGTGSFFTTTVLTDVTDDMLCMNEETFGPLLPITTFKTLDEVIERANASDFGLAAYVFTEKLSNAIIISEELEYGIVGVNDGAPSTAQAPFGGFKESGVGREGGRQGIEDFLETKFVSISL